MNNDLLQVLIEARNGAIAADLNKKWGEVIQAVRESGGKGKLTIDLKIEPTKMAMGHAVVEVAITHETKMKKPELPIGAATFFVLDDGTLTREDPAQVAMFSQEVKQ